MKHKIFVDSGAFSAYQNKTTVNIQDYIRFVKNHLHEIEAYANLDSIGSVEETWKNQEIMEKAGLNPIPVYHLDEPFYYLNRCMEYPYFAIGGLASATGRALDPFLINIFRRLCTEKTDYKPSHKVHGFGIATPEMVCKFPWYSLDTTSWVQYSRYGIILVPKIINQTFRYDKPPMTITISSRSKATGDPNHFRNYPEEHQERFINYFKSKGFVVGITDSKVVDSTYKLKDNECWMDKKRKLVEVIIERGLCNDGDMRTAFNLQFFLDMERNQPEWPWAWKPDSRTLLDEEDFR
jgi:hypothetical protein